MSDWNAAQYKKFEEERTRPAIDLLAHLPVEDPGTIFDLGCGPGNSTELLLYRFPNAHIIGLDSSPAMIATASGCPNLPSRCRTWRSGGPRKRRI